MSKATLPEGLSPVLTTRIQDWRINDAGARTSAEVGAIEELRTTEQRMPWICQIGEVGNLGGITVAVTAPDGRTALVEIELDLGRIAVALRPEAGGDILAKAYVASDAVYVEPCVNPGSVVTGLEGKTFRFAQDGRTEVAAALPGA